GRMAGADEVGRTAIEPVAFIQLGSDLGAPHAEYRSVEIDVLAAGELRMKPRADLQQSSQPSAYRRATGSRLHNLRQYLENGALSRAVGSDHGKDFACAHLERDVPQGPELIVSTVAPAQIWLPVKDSPCAAGQRVPQGGEAVVRHPQSVGLGEIGGLNHCVGDCSAQARKRAFGLRENSQSGNENGQ